MIHTGFCLGSRMNAVAGLAGEVWVHLGCVRFEQPSGHTEYPGCSWIHECGALGRFGLEKEIGKSCDVRSPQE